LKEAKKLLGNWLWDGPRTVLMRFMKYFFPHQLFGKREAYTKEIRKASLERLAHLIKVCDFLMQTKVYLFWGSVNSQGLRNKKVEC